MLKLGSLVSDCVYLLNSTVSVWNTEPNELYPALGLGPPSWLFVQKNDDQCHSRYGPGEEMDFSSKLA